MIELDEPEVETVRICTCLDRAGIALEQTGQHHCAQQVRELQELISAYASMTGENDNNAVEIVHYLFAFWRNNNGR